MSLTHYRVIHDPLKFAGKVYRYGDSIARADIEKVDPGKVGTLLRTRMIEEPPTLTVEDMSMDELRAHARDIGVSGSLPRSKKDLRKLIEESKHGD